MGYLVMLVGFVALALNSFTPAERPFFYILGAALIFVGGVFRIESAIRDRKGSGDSKSKGSATSTVSGRD